VRGWRGAAGRAASALALLVLIGCTSAPVAPEATLYERLGGSDGIAAITEAMLVRSADDARIRDDFAEADIVNLHALLSEHLCALTGGPCTYSGRDMKAAHAGLGITEADFNALVENLVDAMTERGVPIAAQNELLAILAPMRGDVIRQ
jgi:hemoglobin